MPAQDPYFPSGASGPARRLFSITPSDVTEFAYLTTGLYVGTSGDVVVIDVESGTPVTLKNAVAGSLLPIRIARVLATGTTAADLVGLA